MQRVEFVVEFPRQLGEALQVALAEFLAQPLQLPEDPISASRDGATPACTAASARSA